MKTRLRTGPPRRPSLWAPSGGVMATSFDRDPRAYPDWDRDPLPPPVWPTGGASLWKALQLVTSRHELDELTCRFSGDEEGDWVELELKTGLWVKNDHPWVKVTQQFLEKLIAGALKAWD